MVGGRTIIEKLVPPRRRRRRYRRRYRRRRCRYSQGSFSLLVIATALVRLFSALLGTSQWRQQGLQASSERLCDHTDLNLTDWVSPYLRRFAKAYVRTDNS